MTTNEQKVPIWFWIVSTILLLWNIMGVMNFIGQVTMSQETIDALSDLEKSMKANRPIWATMAFGLAVFGGIVGSVLLLLKKKMAATLFMASLVGVITQFGESLITTPREFFTTDVIGLTVTVIVFAFASVYFAKNAAKKGWLK